MRVQRLNFSAMKTLSRLLAILTLVCLLCGCAAETPDNSGAGTPAPSEPSGSGSQTADPNPAPVETVDYAASFSGEAWNAELTRFLGKGAQAMIEGEKKEGKYDVRKHAERLEKIISLWDRFLQIIDEEIPAPGVVEQALNTVGAPVTAEAFGISKEEVYTAFLMTKDIRDKYIGSRLLWDLGLLEETAEELFGK